jgi:Cu/Zn superoxide dismutase
MKRTALGTALLLCVGGAVAVPALASADHAPPGEVRVSLHDTAGAEVAVARLSTVAEGTRVRVSARRLPPGQHGMHLHAVPSCDAATAFTSAGGHYARTGQRHGDHAGDLPPLLVAADGTARTDVVVDGFSLAELFDHDGVRGAALVVHAARDNLANIPTRYRSPDGPAEGGPDPATLATGDSGARIACGVVGTPVPVTAGPAAAGAAGASARMRAAAGADAGVVTVRQLADRVEVRGRVTGLTPGFHGFHVHTTGACDGTTATPFSSAGGHLDPTDEDHGEHHGDLPALLVRADGTASVDLDTDQLDVDTLFDADGAALIVHAGRDNAANIPTRYRSPDGPAGGGPDPATLQTGDSGGRVLCGVLQNGAGTYRAVAPRRLLDTRVSRDPLLPGRSREVRVRPAEQTTTQLAMLTLTAIRPSADTVVTVGPAGTARPVGASAPARRGQVLATTVLVPVSASGSVIVASTSAAHLAVDLRGVYTTDVPVGGGRYSPVTPARVGVRTLTAGAPQRVVLAGRAGVPAADVSGVLVTLTATRPTTDGHLTVSAAGAPVPGTSALNWATGQTRAATIVVPVGRDGAVELRTSARSVDVLVDLVGWYTAAGRAGGRHVRLAPFQVRVAEGAPARLVDRLHLRPGEARDVVLAGVGGVPARGARAVVLAVTAGGTARSHLVVHPTGTPRPPTSNLNWGPGESMTTTVVTPLGAGGAVRLFNNARHAHVGVVVLGYVDAG